MKLSLGERSKGGRRIRFPGANLLLPFRTPRHRTLHAAGGFFPLAILGAMLAAGGVLGGCISARHTPPVAPPLQFSDAKLHRGQVVFYQQCHMCHPHGGTGLGPGIVNKPLPGFLMAFQVRHGLGAMPGFKAEKISAEELDALVAYLKAVHANKPEPENVRPRG